MSLFEKKWNDQPGGADNIYGNKGKSAAGKAEASWFGDDEGAMRHSKHYHDYFRGYTEVWTENPQNRWKPYKIQRVYTAPWITADMERPLYFSYCCCYVLLTLICAVLFVSALVDRSVPGNYSWIVAIPGYLSVVAVFLLAVGTVAYLLRPRQMTLYEHSSSVKRLKAFSLAAAIGCALTALTSLAFLLFAGKGEITRSLITAVKLAAAAAAAFGVWSLERKMTYKEIENKTKLPEGEAHRIQ
ncbi:MAG: hypothetical protein IJH38_07515 [Clostridia bacterium]|nr:hypothetical protein [Clostridia bacterium]